MNIGKWDGHNAEAALLRRLGMPGLREDKEGKPDQNYGEKFRHLKMTLSKTLSLEGEEFKDEGDG
ncbi:MAG TPA: hypothetical protein VLA94_04235 [Syntrophales bacterium]|nr:hypothetical protein [Syntrophales bacterium]